MEAKVGIISFLVVCTIGVGMIYFDRKWKRHNKRKKSLFCKCSNKSCIKKSGSVDSACENDAFDDLGSSVDGVGTDDKLSSEVDQLTVLCDNKIDALCLPIIETAEVPVQKQQFLEESPLKVYHERSNFNLSNSFLSSEPSVNAEASLIDIPTSAARSFSAVEKDQGSHDMGFSTDSLALLSGGGEPDVGSLSSILMVDDINSPMNYAVGTTPGKTSTLHTDIKEASESFLSIDGSVSSPQGISSLINKHVSNDNLHQTSEVASHMASNFELHRTKSNGQIASNTTLSEVEVEIAMPKLNLGNASEVLSCPNTEVEDIAPSDEQIDHHTTVSAGYLHSNESLQSSTIVARENDSRLDNISGFASSPISTDTSTENCDFHSFDASNSESGELPFYDVDSTNVNTPPMSPLERTLTNTPTMSCSKAESPLLSYSVNGSAPLCEEITVNGEDGDHTVLPSAANLPAHLSENISNTSSTGLNVIGYDWLDTRCMTMDSGKVKEAIYQAHSEPDKLDIEQLQVLMDLLNHDDCKILDATLQGLLKATAFTTNVSMLTSVYAPNELSLLLNKHVTYLPIRTDDTMDVSQSLLLNILRVITNLAMDKTSHSQLKGTISILTDLLLMKGISDEVIIASLQPLINLSSSTEHHRRYTRILQQLYLFLDASHSKAVILQCLRLLVNLSLDPNMVPHMLVIKAPKCLLNLLDISQDEEIVLRSVTFLASVTATDHQSQDAFSPLLIAGEITPSSDTLGSALSDDGCLDALRNKAYCLTSHSLEDVRHQASRLYNNLSA